MVLHESTALLGQDPSFPCPSPGVPEPGAAGPHTKPTINPSEAVVSPSCFPKLSNAGKVICSLHDLMDLLLPASGSARSPGTAREADPPLAGACGDAELQDALGQGKKPPGVRRGLCVCLAVPRLGFDRASLPLGRRLKGLH